MVDMSGNYRGPAISFGASTLTYDEAPPAVVSSAVTEKTDTTAKLHLVTNELLKKLKVRYRVTGTDEWLEQVVVPTTTAFDINLTNLIAGKSYECQYILEDTNGNQLIAEWIAM